MGWGLRIKNFNIMGVHCNIRFLVGVHEKSNIPVRLPKKGGLDSLQI